MAELGALARLTQQAFQNIEQSQARDLAAFENREARLQSNANRLLQAQVSGQNMLLQREKLEEQKRQTDLLNQYRAAQLGVQMQSAQARMDAVKIKQIAEANKVRAAEQQAEMIQGYLQNAVTPGQQTSIPEQRGLSTSIASMANGNVDATDQAVGMPESLGGAGVGLANPLFPTAADGSKQRDRRTEMQKPGSGVLRLPGQATTTKSSTGFIFRPETVEQQRENDAILVQLQQQANLLKAQSSPLKPTDVTPSSPYRIPIAVATSKQQKQIEALESTIESLSKANKLQTSTKAQGVKFAPQSMHDALREMRFALATAKGGEATYKDELIPVAMLEMQIGLLDNDIKIREAALNSGSSTTPPPMSKKPMPDNVKRVFGAGGNTGLASP